MLAKYTLKFLMAIEESHLRRSTEGMEGIFAGEVRENTLHSLSQMARLRASTEEERLFNSPVNFFYGGNWQI